MALSAEDLAAEIADGRAIDGAWVTRADAAAAFGVTVDVLDKRFRELAGRAGACERGGPRRLQLYLRGLIEAWVDFRIELALAPVRAELERAQAQRGGPDAGADAELWAAAAAGDGTSSAALERWRTAKAGLAELDLEQRRGDLVDPREFNRLLLRFTTILRGCGETLQRQYGADAQSLLDEGIDEIEREIDRCFATDDDDAETGMTNDAETGSP